MDELTLDEALAELSAAEEFLDYFGIAYEPSVVHVNRLHILQRFHDYMSEAGDLQGDEDTRRAVYASQLERAYEDFVRSDPLTEKVFKVFHMHEPQTAFVPLTAITVSKSAEGAPADDCGCGGKGVCHSSEAAVRS